MVVLFANVSFSLEIYFKDSRSLLIVFLDKKKRSDLEQRLSTILGRPYSDVAPTPGTASLQRTPIFGKMSSRMLSGFRSDELSSATRRWQAREISNVCIVFHNDCLLLNILYRSEERRVGKECVP